MMHAFVHWYLHKIYYIIVPIVVVDEVLTIFQFPVAYSRMMHDRDSEMCLQED